MSMNYVKTFGLAIEIIGVTRFVLLFQIEGRLGIILAGDGQDRLQGAIDLRISRSKKLHMVPVPMQLLAEMVNDALRSPMCLRRNRDINASDLRDLHERVPNPFYTCSNCRQEATAQDQNRSFFITSPSYLKG